MSDVDIILKNRNKYRYTQRKIPVIKNDDLVKWYNFILLENQETLETTVSEFTDFFVSKDKLNLSIKTKMNNYGNTILMFLNYSFFQRENPIDSILDITIELGNEFINGYGVGNIGNEGIKSDQAIERVANSLTSFYYWLSKTKKYKLKYIKKNDFNIVTYNVKLNKVSAQRATIEKTKLECLFTYELHRKTTPKKLSNPSEYLVYSLIKIAEQYDPMITFPIALGAFAGLRRGEICQICRQRIHYTALFGKSTNFYIDLTKDMILRNDGVLTGDIKRPRIQLVYEPFLPYLDKLYKDHLKLLKQRGYDQNPYGALIIDSNGKAMTTKAFCDRFNGLLLKLQKRLNELANKNDVNAALNLDLLIKHRMTPHSLRYFFSEYIAVREPAHVLSMYRGDLDLNTALTYIKDSAKNKQQIANLQDSFIESFCNYTSVNIEQFKEECHVS